MYECIGGHVCVRSFANEYVYITVGPCVRACLCVFVYVSGTMCL